MFLISCSVRGFCFFRAPVEPKPADLGNQGQAEEVLFNQRYERAADCKWPGGSLWRVQCKRASSYFTPTVFRIGIKRIHTNGYCIYTLKLSFLV